MLARTCLTLASALCIQPVLAVAPPHLVKDAAPGPMPPPKTSGSTGAIDNPFTDDFDTYALGSGVAGQGPWSLWDSSAPNAWVDGQFAASVPHSMRLDVGSDVVAAMDISGGIWRLTMQTWFPTGELGVGYIIGLNTFAFPGGPYHWSMDLQFNGATGTVQLSPDPNPPPPVPLITGQWIELRVEVNLDTDTYSAWYDNAQIITDRPWSTGWSGGGLPRIQAFDFYSQSVSGMRVDNVIFQQVPVGCYANCDLSTTPPILNVDDFTCFINEFAAAQSLPHSQQIAHYANCDGSTTAPALNVDDFTCFINAFAAGCP